jgi:hypothetical protein
MSEDIKNTTALTPTSDGFDGYNGQVAGDEGATQQGGQIQGTLLRFGITARWEARDDRVISDDVRLIVTDIIRKVVKWGLDKGPPEETIIVPYGQPFPDIEGMNDAIPRNQWRQGFNGLEGRWQPQQNVVLLNPLTMEVFTFITSTKGGFAAIRELVDKVKAMRKYRGPGVSPIVILGNKPMRTKYGERRRPDFNIIDWVGMRGTGGVDTQPALPAPNGPVSAGRIGASVAPVTLHKEMNDEIPF